MLYSGDPTYMYQYQCCGVERNAALTGHVKVRGNLKKHESITSNSAQALPTLDLGKTGLRVQNRVIYPGDYIFCLQNIKKYHRAWFSMGGGGCSSMWRV